MHEATFTTYRRLQSDAPITCACCGHQRPGKIGAMTPHRDGQPIAVCCMTPRQAKLAAALANPPRSALNLLRQQPGEVLTGPTPKELLGR